MKRKVDKKSVLELGKERVVLFDGAMGTMLFSYGLQFNEPPELWNLLQPEIVYKIHHRYAWTGADVIQTNTFGANGVKLKKSGYEKKMEEINLAAISIAREACPVKKYVAGNIGPTGEFLEPVGKAELKVLKKAFKEQARILVSGGVDLISIETMYDLREAIAAVEGVREVASVPLFVCMTFEKKPKGYFTIMGDEVKSSFRKLKEAGADVVGANCTLGSQEMIDLVSIMRKCTDLPIIAQPNAGKPKIIKGKTVYLQTPTLFAEDITEMVKSGANYVGGCCGTTPGFTKVINEKMNKLRIKKGPGV
ncbi:MAG: homocysteine S-methyltransferase family protein [candidate division Zixibacteria bacterium]|nr:homocysteine S-methyltransferase family protein [candidate division Zixibacteria bacterium]